MNEESELLQKMKTMSKAELADYMHVSNVSSRICAVIGIGSMLLALIFTNVFTVAVAALVVYVAGQIACGVDELKAHISFLINS